VAVLIGNDHGVVYFGPRDNPTAVRWWADRGQLHWEDSRDNGYGIVSVKEFLQRLQAINDMISNGKKKDSEGMMHADEVERHMRFIENAIDLVKKAKEQGMPQDPEVRKHKAQERPINVVMPSSLSSGRGLEF
jgi:hypothetical protein